MSVCVLRQAADLTGQIRGMRSRVRQDKWVSDLAGWPVDFRGVVWGWRSGAGTRSEDLEGTRIWTGSSPKQVRQADCQRRGWGVEIDLGLAAGGLVKGRNDLQAPCLA